MRRKIKSVLIMAVILSLAGCADTTGQDAETVINEASEETMQGGGASVRETSFEQGTEPGGSEALEVLETEVETSESAFGENSFIWKYKQEETGIVIRLEDCECLYESEQFRIWSKYLDFDSRENSSYPYTGELLYLQTPEQSMQLYPDEYVIDYESGTIYTLYNEWDYFVSIYSYCAATSPAGEICGVGILKSSLLEEWIEEAHGLATYSAEKPWAGSSKLRANMTDVSHERGETILRGEASGIYDATGETCFIEWELNITTDEVRVTSVEPRHYDEETDKEVFASCAAAFDQLEQGTDSVSAKGAGDGKLWEGQRIDVNGDGLPDLIQEMEANGLGISPILRIFAYTEGAEEPVQEVFSDLNDMTEYYFVGADGKLIYDYSNHGEMAYGSYSQYRFDENWDRKLTDRIEIYYFYDHYREYEGEHEWYSENYPDTYGARGSGYYYFRCRRRTMEELGDSDPDVEDDVYWAKEEISEREFIRIYREMTGWDFFTVNTDFPRK